MGGDSTSVQLVLTNLTMRDLSLSFYFSLRRFALSHHKWPALFFLLSHICEAWRPLEERGGIMGGGLWKEREKERKREREREGGVGRESE